MKRIFATMLILALFVFAGCAQQAQDTAVPSDDSQQTQPADAEQPPQLQEADVVISLMGRNFEYEDEAGTINPAITVQQGDVVRIEYATESGFHDLVIDELGVATEQVRSEAGVQIVEFTADQAGEFEYYCSVGSHRAQGMYGTFIVE